MGTSFAARPAAGMPAQAHTRWHEHPWHLWHPRRAILARDTDAGPSAHAFLRSGLRRRCAASARRPMRLATFASCATKRPSRAHTRSRSARTKRRSCGWRVRAVRRARRRPLVSEVAAARRAVSLYVFFPRAACVPGQQRDDSMWSWHHSFPKSLRVLCRARPPRQNITTHTPQYICSIPRVRSLSATTSNIS